ncbi:hypothetical protein BDV12DRAFT_199333 [Aspergillus spectabilis]
MDNQSAGIFPQQNRCPACRNPINEFKAFQENRASEEIIFDTTNITDFIETLLVVSQPNNLDIVYIYPNAPLHVVVGDPGWGVFTMEDGSMALGWGVIQAIEETGRVWITEPVEGILVEGGAQYVIKVQQQERGVNNIINKEGVDNPYPVVNHYPEAEDEVEGGEEAFVDMNIYEAGDENIDRKEDIDGGGEENDLSKMPTTCPVCVTLGSGPSFRRACFENVHIRTYSYCGQLFEGDSSYRSEDFTTIQAYCPNCHIPAREFSRAQGSRTADEFFGSSSQNGVQYLLILTGAGGRETTYPYPQTPQPITLKDDGRRGVGGEEPAG